MYVSTVAGLAARVSRAFGPSSLAARLHAAVLLGAVAIGAAQAAPLPASQPLTVTVVNSIGNTIGSLTLTTSSTPPSATIKGLTVLNTDGAQHGVFSAIAWLANPVTGSVDLIAADPGKRQIVRYSGPSYGTSKVIFNWTRVGSGPAKPVGLSVDATGNLYVISPSCSDDAKPGVWVLPFANNAYGKPVLIDRTFNGVKTAALAEVLVAPTAASPNASGVRAWQAGDLLVLVGDSYNARVIVYTKSVLGLYTGPTPPLALAGPTSTAVTQQQFSGLGAVPLGMDVWPADAGHGVSLLATTLDGRVLRFDSAKSAFGPDFANGLGLNLTRIKVGSYSNVPYAFISQIVSSRGGRILQYGAPPASGANKPLASITSGLAAPSALAVTMSGSQPAGACTAPAVCEILGPQISVQIGSLAGGTVSFPNANILQDQCIVPNDPRASVINGVWGCAGGNLDVADYCPNFPHTVLPPHMCGHAGPSGTAFVVLKQTAIAVDTNPAINNSFIQVADDPTLVVPGPYTLNCPAPGNFSVPLIAYAPRSDLPLVEGSIVEDANTPYFVELTGYCDKGGTSVHTASMFAYGLGLNMAPSGLPAGLPGLVTTKYANTLATLQNAQPQINSTQVYANLYSYISQSNSYFSNASLNANYSCAANFMASADAYLRKPTTLSAFSFAAPPGNPNASGELDGRFANIYLSLVTYFLPAQGSNATWPLTGPPAQPVPPCVTITASAPTVVQGQAATLTFGPVVTPDGGLYYPPTQCTVSGTSGNLLTPYNAPQTAGTVSTGALTTLGTYTATLMCTGYGGSSGNAQTTFTVVPPLPQITTGLGATPASAGPGGTTSLSWASSNATSCSISGAGLALSALPATSSGTVVTLPAGQAPGAYTLTLSCSGAAGAAPATSSLPFTVTANPPQITTPLAVAPSSVLAGASTLLSWASSNATSCSITGAGLNLTGLPASSIGTPAVVPAADAPGLYLLTLSCAGAAGAAVATSTAPLTVVALPPPVISTFTASPTSVLGGGYTTLTWTTSNVSANGCSITGAGTSLSDQPASGAASILLTAGVGVTYPITLTCYDTSGTTTASATVNVTAPVLQTLNLSATGPQTVPLGGTLNLSASGGYSDGSSQDVSLLATWASADSAVATVTNAQAPAVVAGQFPGVTTITASIPGVSAASVQVTVPTPAATFTVNGGASATVTTGTSVTLAWSTTGYDPSINCLIVPTSGIELTVPSGAGSTTTTSATATTITYLLSCPQLSPVPSVTVTFTTPVAPPVPMLIGPQGMAFDASGNLWVASSGDGQVLVYTPTPMFAQNYGQYVLSPGSTRTAGLSTPARIAFDLSTGRSTSGNLYVADLGSGSTPASVVAFNAAGSPIPGYTYTAVSQPRGIAVDAASSVYVADASGNASNIQVLTPGASALTQAAVWTQDNAHVAFQSIGALAFNALTSDIGAAIGGSNQATFYNYTQCGSQPCLIPVQDPAQPTIPGLAGPTGLAFDSSSNVYVSNATGTVSKYQAGTATALPLTLTGAPVPVTAPQGVAVDVQGNIYVASTPNNVVQVFDSTGVYQYTMGNVAIQAKPYYDANFSPTTSAYLAWTSPGLPSTATCSLSSSDDVYNSTPEPLSSGGLVVTPAAGATLPVTYTLTCGDAGGTASVATVQVPSVSITPSYLFQGSNVIAGAYGQAPIVTVPSIATGYQFNFAAAGVPAGSNCQFTTPNLNQSFSAQAVSVSYVFPSPRTPAPFTASYNCTVGSYTTNTASWTLLLQ